MIKDAEIPQIENICTRLLQGFIGWIEINDKQEIGIILDSAYDFKHQILNIDIKTQVKDYKPPIYKKVNNKLLDQCNEVYLKLKEKIKY